MFNYEEMELFLKTRGRYFENNKEINPKYGIIYSIVDSENMGIVAVGIVDFPFDFLNSEIPQGHRLATKEEVIFNTRRGIRYTTITRTLYDPWVPGQLIHTDGNEYISTNPNDTTRDNLRNLALGEFTVEEIQEFLEGSKD